MGNYDGLFCRETVKRITLGGREVKLSDKAKQIQSMINDFGCNAEAVARLVSILIGENIRVPEKEGYVPGLAVVPLSNPNSHNYILGEPCVIFYSSRGVRLDGSSGNDLPNWNKDAVRKATEEEIDKFFDITEGKLPIGAVIVEGDE